MRYARQDKDGALFWADRGVGYVVSGGSDRERLTQVARLVYDQTEKSGGLKLVSLLSQFRHRKSGIGTSTGLNIAPGDHAKLRCVRSADRRRRPRLGFCTALVPRSRPHLFFGWLNTIRSDR